MKILITGGCGFIGSFLVRFLLKYTNHNLILLDRMSYTGNLNRINELTETDRFKIIYQDLRSEINDVTSNLIGNDIGCIVHLAASCHVDKSIKDPLTFVYNNVVGTCNILNFARKQNNLKKFLLFSTDEVFGSTNNNMQVDEYFRYNCTNPYSATKAGSEELAKSFFYTYGLPVNIIHCNNVYGETQQKEAFIPICIQKILNSETLNIHGSADSIPVRRYIYAEDVAGYLNAIINCEKNSCLNENIRKPIIYNITSNNKHNILTIAQNISKILKKDLKYIFTQNIRKNVDYDYHMLNNNLKQLKYSESFNFEETLGNVVKWYISNKEWLI